MRSPGKASLMAVLVAGAAASAARADDRKFTYSYEAKTLPQGTWEAETWATLQEGKESGRWSTLHLRDEIEYGLTDRVNGSIYLNWSYQANSQVPGFENEHSVGFDSMSTEWKVKLTEPSTDLVGLLLYEEFLFSNNAYELETKLVLSKEVGPFTFAYNFVWEAVLNHATDPAQSPQWTWEHEISNTFGASYGFSNAFAVGVEAYDIARFDTFQHTSTRADYVGPNVHVSSGSWWATLTALRQVSFGRGPEYTDPDNTKWQIRLIVGINF